MPQPSRPAPRIHPVERPYEESIAAMLADMMPAGSPLEPLRLFRLFARHPPMARAMHALGGFVLGGKERALRSRDREIVIERVCARCGCEYEWGVHAAAFGPRVGLEPAQLAASAVGDAEDPAWQESDRLLVRMVDELHDHGTVSDQLWKELASHWNVPQLLELLLVAGWYHAISYLANAAAVAGEEWAARFPAAPD
ncbi:MAG TPA: carboxymuconolactone decarboxylase family protein [Candidatus Binatia bacterium]|jgi:alkylhydroperoxidase family enzyme